MKNTAIFGLLAMLTVFAGGCSDDTASDEPSCTDGLTNGDETDVDCGGNCGVCATGQGCSTPGDCDTGICSSDGVCAGPSCDDGMANGEETDVDCGGSCGGCATGETCGDGDDCISAVCGGTTCDAATCDDGVKNGDEARIDCGGSCAACTMVVDDFERDTSAWATQYVTFGTHPDNGTTAMLIENNNDENGCASGFGTLASVAIPAGAKSLQFDISGDVTAGGDPHGQMWFTLDSWLGLPAFPIADLRTDTFCIPASLRGASARLQFVIRSSGTCGPVEYDVWIDNIILSGDDTGCTAMSAPI